MTEVMGSLAIEPIFEASRSNDAASRQVPRMPAVLPLGAEFVARRTRWSSSLCERDLQCLLRVIEADLIPQLLNSYSPSRHVPLDRIESPG